MWIAPYAGRFSGKESSEFGSEPSAAARPAGGWRILLVHSVTGPGAVLPLHLGESGFGELVDAVADQASADEGQ